MSGPLPLPAGGGDDQAALQTLLGTALVEPLPGREATFASMLARHVDAGWPAGSVLELADGPVTEPSGSWRACLPRGRHVRVRRDSGTVDGTPLASSEHRCIGGEIPFPDRRFDLALVDGSLDTAATPDLLLRELRRVLTADGWLLGRVAAFDPLRPGLRRLPTPYGLMRMLADAGLDLIEIRPGADALALMHRRYLGQAAHAVVHGEPAVPATTDLTDEFLDGTTPAMRETARLTRAAQLLFVAGRRGRRPSPPPEGDDAANFPGSRRYWERRYASGGNSGAGSYGELAVFKARVLNEAISELGLADAIEWGCGDGHQLTLLRIAHCTGVDVSESALARCRERFADDRSRRFVAADAAESLEADVSMSLDVLYHLVEDEVFDLYMRRLFGSARRLVVVYSSNHDSADAGAPHVRHRRFTDWVGRHAAGWRLWRHVPNPHPWHEDARGGSFADFYLFRPLLDGHDGDTTWQTAGSTNT